MPFLDGRLLEVDKNKNRVKHSPVQSKYVLVVFLLAHTMRPTATSENTRE